MHRKKIFLLIFLTVVSGMPVLPVAQRQKQDIPSSHKYLVHFPLNPYQSQQGIRWVIWILLRYIAIAQVKEPKSQLRGEWVLQLLDSWGSAKGIRMRGKSVPHFPIKIQIYIGAFGDVDVCKRRRNWTDEGDLRSISKGGSFACSLAANEWEGVTASYTTHCCEKHCQA